MCWGGLGPEGALRATIISGALWAVLDPPGPGGHYAAQLGPGWASGKGRIPYALLSIVDALREAPPGGWAERWGSAADGRCCGLAWRCQPTNPACFYAPLLHVYPAAGATAAGCVARALKRQATGQAEAAAAGVPR